MMVSTSEKLGVGLLGFRYHCLSDFSFAQRTCHMVFHPICDAVFVKIMARIAGQYCNFAICFFVFRQADAAFELPVLLDSTEVAKLFLIANEHRVKNLLFPSFILTSLDGLLDPVIRYERCYEEHEQNTTDQ